MFKMFFIIFSASKVFLFCIYQKCFECADVNYKVNPLKYPGRLLLSQNLAGKRVENTWAVRTVHWKLWGIPLIHSFAF